MLNFEFSLRKFQNLNFHFNNFMKQYFSNFNIIITTYPYIYLYIQHVLPGSIKTRVVFGFKKKPETGLDFGKTRTRTWSDYMLNYQKPSYVCVLFFGQYSGLSGIKELGPPKSFLFVVWWTGLGSPQLCWADYKPSCAQKMDPTTRTYSYIQIYIYIYIYIYCRVNGSRTVKK